MENHRINDKCIIVFNETPNVILDFPKKNNQFVLPNDVSQTVWNDTHRVNKLYSEQAIIDIETLNKYNQKAIDVVCKVSSIDVKAFGILLVIYDFKTEEYLCSRLITTDEFRINSQVELIDGRFWNYQYHLNIPHVTNARYGVQMIEVFSEDISKEPDNIGTIFNYPTIDELVPIISNSIQSDKIGCKLFWNDNQYLSFGIYTTENKSIEQSLRDLFEEDNPIITVDYLITYGNENVGWKNLTLVNYDNTFGQLSLLPDLRPFIGHSVTAIVTMNVKVNGKLLQRQIQSVPQIIDSIYVFDTVISKDLVHNVVEVKIDNNIQQQVFQLATPQREIVKVTERIETQKIDSNQKVISLNSNNRIVTFDSNLYQITANSIFVVIDSKTDSIITVMNSKLLNDTTYCFDLDLLYLKKPSDNMIYKVFEDGNIILSGEIKK